MGHIDGYGGAQTAFRKLHDFIKGEGYMVKVITVTNKAREEQPFTREELLGRIVHHGSRPTVLIKKTVGCLYAGMRAWRFQPDIFVCVGLNNSANLIARFLGSKCFKIGQDFIARRPLDDKIWYASRAVLNGIGLQAPSMLDYWRGAGIDITGVNWLPCFPEPPITGILRSKHSAFEGEIRLAYFGRLVGNKGLPLLLKAFSTSSISQKTTLDLWGQGIEEIPLRKLVATLRLEERVRFLGAYPAYEKGARLMVSYDALVLCSTGMEGLPLVLLEAMAYGLPFLATDVGAIRDCCENNPDAVLVQPTHEDIIRGLGLLIERINAGDFDPRRLQLFYDRTFSHKVMAARWRVCFQNPKHFFREQNKTFQITKA
jgi:glycosyltransferase involved in cell wall biosynthesis